MLNSSIVLVTFSKNIFFEKVKDSNYANSKQNIDLQIYPKEL